MEVNFLLFVYLKLKYFFKPRESTIIYKREHYSWIVQNRDVFRVKCQGTEMLYCFKKNGFILLASIYYNTPLHWISAKNKGWQQKKDMAWIKTVIILFNEKEEFN